MILWITIFSRIILSTDPLSISFLELSEVLWSMVMQIALKTGGYTGAIMLYVIFAFWAVLTISILGIFI